MKYSLKNKEFNKKRLAIFDNNNKRSRSKSTSRTPNKSHSKDRTHPVYQQNDAYQKYQKLNTSALDRLQSHGIQNQIQPQTQKNKSYFEIQKNQQKTGLLQSFANNKNYNIQKINRVQLKNQALKPCQPLRISNCQAIKLQKVNHHQNNSFNKNQSFQVCQQLSQNPSRINRFMTQVLFQRQKSQSPHNKVVFQPIVRKSMSPSPAKSISPQPFHNINPQISNQYNINFPNKISFEGQIQNKNIVRKIVFSNKRQQFHPSNNIRNITPQKQLSLSPQNSNINKQNQQITYLKKTIQQQVLQIQYLKNQKQILQSNIQLRYSPKKVGYQEKLQDRQEQDYRQRKSSIQNNFGHSTVKTIYRITPEKYGAVYTPNQNIRNQSMQNQQLINQQLMDRNKILQLCQILDSNQIKIKLVQNKLFNVYQNIIKRYNQNIHSCQQKLIQIFSVKYLQFSQQLRTKLNYISEKYQKIDILDQKIDLFSNTFRNLSENLRITKLKQQNIQLMIENQYKKTDKFWSPQPSKLLLNQSDISSIRRFDDNQLQQKERQDIYKLSKNIKQKQKKFVIKEQKQQSGEFSSFLDQKYSHLVYNRKKQSSKSKQKQLNLIGDHINQKHNVRRENKSKHFRKQVSPKGKQLIYQKTYDSKQINLQNSSTSEQIQHFSPFSANQMFKKQKYNPKFNQLNHKSTRTMSLHSGINSNHHSYNKNGQNYDYVENKNNLSFGQNISQLYDFSKNSFDIQFEFQQKLNNHLSQSKFNTFNHKEQKSQFKNQSKQKTKLTQKSKEQHHKDISFNSKTAFQKQTTQTFSQKSQIEDTLQGQQERLIKILSIRKYNFPLQCWLDDLGCLRKKNQTYLFDQQGSVIMTTKPAFKKLKQRKLFL